jgi:ABC-2 type transport system permease protein
VNRPQFRTILWLRWRLSVNRARRGGTFNLVLTSILLAGAAIASIGLFLTALVVGTFLLPKASSEVILFLWDGVVAAYLFCWLIELTVELQRGELLSLEKLLHLPASLFDVFLLNYVGSWISITHLLFLPGMVGLALAMVLAKGWGAIVILPALAGFLLLMTAIAYQVRGWLATLMSNPRRRRTVVAVITLTIVLVAQLPNLTINLGIRPWEHGKVTAEEQSRFDALDAELRAGKLSADEHAKRTSELHTQRALRLVADSEARFEQVTRIARTVNACLPVGWLPLGADAATRGNPWPSLLGAAGAGLLAAISLRRAYRTTIRHVTQGGAAAVARPAKAKTAAHRRNRASVPWVERRLPWTSEQTAAVAWAQFQSYARATEVRLLLITPVIILVVLGAMLYFGGGSKMPAAVRPLVALGAVGMMYLPLIQLYCNQFGFDRAGFRTFVLSGVPRTRVLLGKNLALAPLSLTPALVGVIAVQWLAPMPLGQCAASVLQLPIVFLAFCMVGNLASILAPFPVAGGTMKPATGMSSKALFNALFGLTMPLTLAPSLAPLALELLLDHFEIGPRLPLYFLGTLVELLLLVWLYRAALGAIGRLLQRREVRILDAVTVGIE